MAVVIAKIKLKWQPEQMEGVSGRISYMSIYRYLHEDKRSGGDLYHHLAHKLNLYRTNKLHNYRGQIANRKTIHNRPGVVDEKQRIGDWEIDTVVYFTYGNPNSG